MKAKVDDNYVDEIQFFEEMAEEFYDAGKEPFLSEGTTIVGNETPYVHILRFVSGPLARLTFERHGVGIGVFTLQGYERQNQESKYLFVRHTNKLYDFVKQILRKLTEKFNDGIIQLDNIS